MDDIVTETEQPTSKYNSAIDNLMRIGFLWRDAHRHAINGNFERWNSILDRIYLELCGDFKEGDDKEKEFYAICTKLAKYPFKKNSRGFDTLNDNWLSMRGEQYKILFMKEAFLRRLQNLLGKGTAWYDEEDDGI